MPTAPATRPALLSMVLAALTTFGCGGGSPPQAPPTRQGGSGKPDVVFIATPDKVVDRMLELGEVGPSDVVYDLGCGDGRIVIAAAKRYGARGVGIEIDPKVADEARKNIDAAGVGHLVTIRTGDVFDEDFSEATVVTLYLLPDLNELLKPKLAKLRPGSRIVSHSFPMRGAKPEHSEKVAGKNVYKWRVPWQNE